MSETPTIKVNLYYTSQGAAEDGLPTFLKDAIPWLQKILDEVPIEYKDSVIIDVGTDGDYDSPQPELSIWYRRPKTADEIADDKRSEHARWAAQCQHDMANLQRLAAKFGVKIVP